MTAPEELVAALLAVPGVASAAIEPTDAGPGTLRLQLQPGVDEVGVAGAVNRLLRSRFGLAVDTDRVRVVEPGLSVQPGPAPVAEAVAAEPAPAYALNGSAESERRRIVIDRVQLISAGLSTTVLVTLLVGGTPYQGSADGTATADSLNRAVVAATLRALEAIVDRQARFDVDHVELAATGSERTALVVLTMVTDRAVQKLSGASVVREDERQAVIRAVLAAVNRRINPLL